MRRLAFYFAVALLAFGVGSLFVFVFYKKDKLEFTVEKVEIDIKQSKQNIDNKTPLTKFVCDDEAINTVWKMLMKNKTFLNDAYINDAYINVVQSRQIKDCRELFDVKPIKLNDDKDDEFIVIGNYLIFCDSGGDCQTWIVARKQDEYEIIFSSTAGKSTTKLYIHTEIEPLHVKTHGFKDLKVFIPNGWSADNIGYFKFDGTKYRLEKCLKDVNSEYVYDNYYAEKWLRVKSSECLKRNFF